MPTPTPELGLQKAIDSDDTADYLDTGLSQSLTTVDGLFNNVTGHTHGGVHQGGPINAIPVSAIPDGSITSAKITDGAIQTIDLADGCVSTAKIVDGAITTTKIASGVTLTSVTLNSPTLNSATSNSPSIGNPTINGTVSGSAVFTNGPTTNDWFRVANTGLGIYNAATGGGVGFDAGGPFVYGAYGGGHLITETAAQTLTNKTINSPSINSPTLNSPVLNSPTIGGNVSGGVFVNLRQSGPAAFGVGGADLTNYMINWGTGTFTLPNASTAYAGVFRAVKAYGGAATVNCGTPLYGPGTSANGAISLNNGDSVTCWCDGTNWWAL